MSGHEHELPPAALFSTIAICPWREVSPRVDGNLSDWSEKELMPALGELSGGEQYADLSLAWNERGFYLALEVPKDQQVLTNRANPAAGDALELFIDTRGAQSSHRATQFCYHLWVLPVAPPGGGDAPVIFQQPIRRALRRSPDPDFRSIRMASSRSGEGYALELALEPESLHGLEPAGNGRLAIAAIVHDIARGRQYWGTSPDIPYERDPATWGLVRLKAPPERQ